MKPIDVNEKQNYENLYGTVKEKIRNTNMKIGDKVRIPYDFNKFDEGYYPTYQNHVFTVEKTIKGDNKYVFKIKDYKGNLINQIFYPEQL